MEKIKKYEESIISILEANIGGRYLNATGIETFFSIDSERHHYFLYMLGWKDKKRTHSILLHLDIINEKIWVQENNTEIQIGLELINRGVLREDIILAFHYPGDWKFTDYGYDESYIHKIVNKEKVVFI